MVDDDVCVGGWYLGVGMCQQCCQVFVVVWCVGGEVGDLVVDGCVVDFVLVVVFLVVEVQFLQGGVDVQLLVLVLQLLVNFG